MAARFDSGGPSPEVSDRLADLARALSARAAGAWRLEGDRLAQVAFVAGPGLDADVARAFAEATRSVPLAEADLGIVRAATLGAVTVSTSAGLPAESGSGRWLRAFGASRSVAVPIRDARGAVVAVVSVALAEGPPDDQAVVDRIRSVHRAWTSLTPG